MTNTDKIRIKQQLNIYGYTNSIDSIYAQIKKNIRKATYKNSDVYVEVKVEKYHSIGIRVHTINSRKFEIA